MFVSMLSYYNDDNVLVETLSVKWFKTLAAAESYCKHMFEYQFTCARVYRLSESGNTVFTSYLAKEGS